MIRITCPQCKATVTAPDTAAGKVGVCGKCQTRMPIPNETPVILAVEPAQQGPLNPCPSCHRKLAFNAQSCPHCGHFFKSATNTVASVGVVILKLIFWLIVIGLAVAAMVWWSNGQRVH